MEKKKTIKNIRKPLLIALCVVLAIVLVVAIIVTVKVSQYMSAIGGKEDMYQGGMSEDEYNSGFSQPAILASL